MNIRVDLNYPIKDGTEVVFRSPVDCSQVTGLKVYYPGADGNTTSKEFAFADAHGNNVGDIDHLFAENVVVKVILDVTTGMAFVQNADTNAYLEGRFSAIENELAQGIVCESSGSVISVSDSSNSKLNGLTIYGKTTQNGTPSPTSPVPLVVAGDSGAIKTTVCGKNLLPYPYKSTNATSGGLTYEVQNDGGIKISGTKTGTSYFNILGAIGDDYQTEKIRFTKPVYVLLENGFSISARLTDGTYTEISGDKALNKPIGALYVNCNVADNTVINTVLYPMVSYINSTEYEPYKGQTLTASTPNGLPGIPVTSGGNYTDENGQAWICDEIDFARGVYVQRIGKVTFKGTETLQETSANYIYTKVNLHDSPKPSSLVSSTHSPTAERINAAQNLLFPKAVFNFNSVDDFKAYLLEQSNNGIPLTCLYQLETPTETALSAEELAAYAELHTNKPNTTVYTDSNAGIGLEYNADIKTYIDSEIRTVLGVIENGTY